MTNQTYQPMYLCETPGAAGSTLWNSMEAINQPGEAYIHKLTLANGGSSLSAMVPNGQNWWLLETVTLAPYENTPRKQQRAIETLTASINRYFASLVLKETPPEGLTAGELTATLGDLLALVHDDPDGFQGLTSELASVRSFSDAGVMSTNDGLVVTFEDGSEFQITVVRSR